VLQWKNDPRQLADLNRILNDNVASLNGLRTAIAEGKSLTHVRKEVDRLLVAHGTPKRTPAGIIIGRETRLAFIDQMDVSSLPTLSIETAISDHQWRATGYADRNTVIDKMHFISALPYVDEFVSNDRFFTELYPVACATNHVRARLTSNAEFSKRLGL
jgi:hypothetical protein